MEALSYLLDPGRIEVQKLLHLVQWRSEQEPQGSNSSKPASAF